MAGRPRKGKYDILVANFIDEFWKTEFRSPSIREVATAIGTKNVSVARNVIIRVASTGNYFFGQKGDARSITPKWVIEAIKNAVGNV